MTWRNDQRCLFLAILSLIIVGCDLPYYWQATHGQLSLLQQRQSIEQILSQQSEPESVLHQLDYSQQVRKFAVQQLGLENNNSYQDYVDLKRPYVVWNVFATPALSLNNHTWCYPIAGCTAYRGYFSEQQAQEYAATLDAQGLDTYVSGAVAYSTLGWFDDPILNTFLEYDNLTLAALLFHELAHQTLFVKNDTLFNESYASALETLLLQRWAESHYPITAWQQYQRAQKRHQQFLDLVLENKAQRQALFESDRSKQEKHSEKSRLIQQLQKRYQQFKQHWNHYSGYDDWFDTDLNNAQLSSVSAYSELTPYFLSLFRQTHEDIPSFIEACRQLAWLPLPERHQQLKSPDLP